MRRPEPFDITAGLPEHTTVLEASAGTGKTYAIVGLAARYLADGVPISEMLLVTFSRAATAELRERMRARVRELLDALADPAEVLSGPAQADDDALLRQLASGTPEDVRTRRGNLARALSDFDASTIATTHTFCNRMLEALGFLGERELVYSIVEEVDELTEEVALDLYLRGFWASDSPEFSFAEAREIARDAVRQASVALAPDERALADGPALDHVAARRVSFAKAVRQHVETRKRDARVRTYDDLQAILHRIVNDDVVGDRACQRIRDTFSVVLVDEFQDTDPLQWDILRRCFHGHRRMILVGDPKQSIYGFRGAEVLSYLAAVSSADTLKALDVNRRSDGALVGALQHLYGEATLGHPEIVARPVQAAFAGSRLEGRPPFRLRAFLRRDFGALNSFNLPGVKEVRSRIAADVADDIANVLAVGDHIDLNGVSRPVDPGDIAVLVRLNSTIEPLQRELAERGINSVIGSGVNVFSTSAAQHWLWVLRAVEQPSRSDRVRIAALTTLFGWSTERVATAAEPEIAELGAELSMLARVFAQGGFAAMAQRLFDAHEVAARVLTVENGERTLTDLIQVSALCNKHVVETGEGLSALVEWLTERITDTSSRQRYEDQSRRLDRDTQAVQIMTVHASKGLQFPIVYVPYGWDGTWVNDRGNITYHDESGTRRLDVGGQQAPDRAARRRRYADEVAGEDLRLLYVALTRAQSQVVAWWAPSRNTTTGPLHRLIFGRENAIRSSTGDPEWTVAGEVPIPEADADCVGIMRTLAERDPSISVEPAGRLDTDTVPPAAGDGDNPAALDIAHFDRRIDQDWRRTSYSALTADVAHGAHGSPGGPSTSVVETGSEPDDEVTDILDDEPVALPGDVAEDVETDSATMRHGMPSLMNGLPFGAAFGTLVHEVLEYVDTSAPEIDAHVRELCSRALGALAGDIDPDRLVAALIGVLTTPLGFGNLWSIDPRDRLAELDFELPLGPAGEAASDGGTTLDRLADLMEEHLPESDPLRAYADHLRAVPGRRLRGFLTGSIDSVLRIPDGRYVIVDYKTNRIRPGDLVVEDFDAEAMAGEMIAAHYPLQAMLYSVALHRYLRWRVPDYEPARHLGPVQYHFVRGMAGPDTPPGCGVFEWMLPAGLVVDLSDALAGAESSAGTGGKIR
ncbi:exodeoxyribonuclease V subunit beta [Gordonia alkanivorans]|uniref:UvrD-helicase domain-containing protein n=1 Tax=Gordonia alkanivorans TaxID=84096 RepID=UPI000FDE936A|nr:UvrD-helicase domain-containing protein [Gordonia alkanivorans]AZZ82490.1 exodeoxyribonuclease V subunit beta [Gordonia alkanivorans]